MRFLAIPRDSYGAPGPRFQLESNIPAPPVNPCGYASVVPGTKRPALTWRCRQGDDLNDEPFWEVIPGFPPGLIESADRVLFMVAATCGFAAAPVASTMMGAVVNSFLLPLGRRRSAEAGPTDSESELVLDRDFHRDGNFQANRPAQDGQPKVPLFCAEQGLLLYSVHDS